MNASLFPAQKPVAASPYLNIKGASDALQFYKQAFGAQENYRLIDPVDGRIGHAEFELGGMVFMLSDEYPDYGAVSPVTLGGSPVKFHLTVSDIDAYFANALEAGATTIRDVKEEFHGNRSGVLADPFGFSWHISQPIEELSAEEMQERWASFTAS